MKKMRVYELAKEKKMSSKDMLVVLKRIGIEVKSHMSVLEKNDLEKIEEFFAPKRDDGKDKKLSPDMKEDYEEFEQDDRIEKVKAGSSRKANGGKKKSGKFHLSKKKEDQFKEKDRPVPPKQPEKKKGKPVKSSQLEAAGGRPAKKAAAPPPPPPAPAIKKITVGESIRVQELAKRMGKTANEVIKKLFELGIPATLNQEIDADTAVIVASEFGIETEVKIEKPITEIEDLPDPEESLVPRPPVVTVMGHVDHGKTSLLDAIRETNVTATEAGGITQHIGAYQVTIKGKKITFLDTPGHEAFTAMRARGAQATDIAVLVVAADDGVMPQTIEAINHCRAANVPMIVAVNKMDKPTANPERVKQQLAEHGLIPEEWGGDTIFVPVSAKMKRGIDQLLEMILLVAEINDLKANPNRPARGVVIEAELDKGRGSVATVLVQKGTLRVGDNIVIGSVYGKVRAMFDDKGRRVKEALPSTPVEVLGLSAVPEPGDIFDVVADEKLAKEIATQREIARKEKEYREASKMRLEDLFKQMKADGVRELNLVLKSDVHGSAEALSQALQRLSTDEVKVNIIHNAVGAISEADIMLAAASNAIVIGFNVRPDGNARRAAEQEKVEVRSYRVIYDVIEDIKAAMSGLLEPELKEVFLGQVEVRAVFKVPRVGNIAGGYVLEGKITNKAHVRVVRNGVVIHEGKLHSLKRFKDDVKEVPQGYECGIGIENFNDIKEGDIIEAYEIQEVKREL